MRSISQHENSGNVKTFAKAHLYRWLKRLHLKDRESSVLRALVRTASPEGVCKVSWDALCQETRMTRTTLYRHLKSLRSKGLVSSRLNYNRRGKRIASTYHLNIDHNDVQRGPTKFQNETPITTDLSDSDNQPGVSQRVRLEEDGAAAPLPWPKAPPPMLCWDDLPPPWDDLPDRRALQ